MKFGKQILAQQIPGWSQYYLDYKALKKIVSSLEPGRPSSEPVPVIVNPTTLLGVVGNTTQPPVSAGGGPPNVSAVGRDDDGEPNLQAIKTAFFFRLERELEKINSFYLQKEAELKLRVETLLSKRRTAALRVVPDDDEDTPKNRVEWKAVEEGFRLLERDLAKLQQFVDLNATGFRKILKKWDKRSKSTTKELYLARQVEVQPVFDRQLIAELSDVVASCLLDLTDLSIGINIGGSATDDLLLTRQIAHERSARMGPYRDLETHLLNAVKNKDETAIREAVQNSDILYQQPGGKTHVTRILWKGVIDAPPDLADLILSSPAVPFDFLFVDDINGRTCLHEAAISGELRLLNICLEKGVSLHQADVYGRTALHYASMNGHAALCRRLISEGLQPSSSDMDNYTPLIYAVIRGHAECVEVLLNDGKVDVGPTTSSNDLIPLSLACQVGHEQIVLLLLKHNAKFIPNTNGEYPIHLAAREGHAKICRLLEKLDGWDLPDKYNEWTPLFHAARHGHESCVQVLVELGNRVNVLDETNKPAVFYAAWYGHLDCVKLLLSVSPSPIIPQPIRSPTHVSPTVDSMGSAYSDSDIDVIPSLSLPPPIMPYRVYGHNYLDKSSLLHVSIGHHFSRMGTRAPPVQLVPRITGPSADHYPIASPLFKLVMTSKPDITAAPYSIPIPIRDERDIFTFQTRTLDSLSLEFSVYPNFGTKTIGRAIALSSLIQESSQGRPFLLPILDHHLHVIGEVAFEVNIITPFEGVTLEIGGAVETYWKSLAMPQSASRKRPTHMAQPSRSSLGSTTHMSPSIYTMGAPGGRAVTLSSVNGDFIYLVVQVTRDLEPVLYDQWRVPIDNYDLGIADVTYTQVKKLLSTSGKNIDITRIRTTSLTDWHSRLSGSLISLRDVLKYLPPSTSVFLELASPTVGVRERFAFGHQHNTNTFVDSVLKAVYDSHSTHSRRRVVFSSFSPDISAALNWKQPNYPVIFASECGVRSLNPPSATALLTPGDVDDRRLSSINSAVDWAKTNNLLGVFFDADLLTKVPALIQGVKYAGLLIGAYGIREQTSNLAATFTTSTIATSRSGGGAPTASSSPGSFTGFPPATPPTRSLLQSSRGSGSATSMSPSTSSAPPPSTPSTLAGEGQSYAHVDAVIQDGLVRFLDPVIARG